MGERHGVDGSDRQAGQRRTPLTVGALKRPPEGDELIPQGGGDREAGHRCPGEDVTIALLRTLGPRLARLDYDVPEQDPRIPLNRMPARVRSGFVMDVARVPAAVLGPQGTPS
ncbi:hypothetical protein [Streptomyces massasporeus]|uniref:hypothetical protein n=1 Tax=Streptomyces massasporeus TaxID=67324 RepID=UPI003F4D2EE4